MEQSIKLYLARQIAARINEISKSLNNQKLIISMKEKEYLFFADNLQNDFINIRGIFSQYNLEFRLFKLPNKKECELVVTNKSKESKENDVAISFPFELVKIKLAHNAKNLI